MDYLDSRRSRHYPAILKQASTRSAIFANGTISSTAPRAMVPNGELSMGKLVKSADTALYIAKEHGRNGTEYLKYGQED